MITDFPGKLENAESLSDIFELVKSAVDRQMNMSRGGLMLGLADLGNHPNGFFGAFYPVGTNIIFLNRTPLERLRETRPELYNPYTFHVLLHEYLHSLGYLDETTVKMRCLEITASLFGREHLAFKLATDVSSFIPDLAYPEVAWAPSGLRIELVGDFDRSSASYIN